MHFMRRSGGYGIMNPYDVYIRVRKTPMGNKYYGHTLGGGEVVGIEIEPPTRGSSGINPSVHSDNISDSKSDTSIPQTTQDSKLQNDENLRAATKRSLSCLTNVTVTDIITLQQTAKTEGTA